MRAEWVGKVILVLHMTVICCHGFSILLSAIVSSKSHRNTFYPIAKGLINKGHDVVMLTPQKSSATIRGLEEIILDDLQPAINNFFNMGHDLAFKYREDGRYMLPSMNVFSEICEATITGPGITKLLQSRRQFDLIIISGMLNECTLGLVYYYNVPFIYLNPMTYTVWTGESTGNPDALSYVPLIGTNINFKLKMNFFQRVKNSLFAVIYIVMRRYFIMPPLEATLKKHFGDNMPSLSELDKNTSLVLLNTHHIINYMRPYLPNIIEVGGLNCVPPNKLSKDLEDFIEGAGKDGFIYFSLGSVINTRSFPEIYRKAFIKAFSQIPQRVIWKWDEETMEGQPPNVKLGKWLPQQDLLGHPKLRLFITHAGANSIQETLCHGSPVIAIPVFGDQDANAQKAEMDGYCIMLEIIGLTSDKLLSVIRKITEDPSYGERARELGTKLLDQPQPPLEQALFWIEYVIRHKGAPHIRSVARDLPWYEYLLLDVTLFIVLMLALAMILIGALVYCMYNICRRFCLVTKKKSKLK